MRLKSRPLEEKPERSQGQIQRSVGIFPPQPTIQQRNLTLCNIVAKTEPPRPNPVLAFARRNPLQLLDWVFVALVVGVQRKNSDRFFKPLHEVRMLGCKFLQQSVEMRGGNDEIRWRVQGYLPARPSLEPRSALVQPAASQQVESYRQCGSCGSPQLKP